MVVGHKPAPFLTHYCKLLQLCRAIPSPALDVWPWNLLSLLIFQQCWWILVSLCNRMAERRGRQNTCVWQKWQGYYSCVLSWSSVKLMFSGLLQKDLFKEECSSAEHFFKQNYCHTCHTRFADSFPLPSSCVSSLLHKTGCEVDYAKYGCSH